MELLNKKRVKIHNFMHVLGGWLGNSLFCINEIHNHNLQHSIGRLHTVSKIIPPNLSCSLIKCFFICKGQSLE